MIRLAHGQLRDAMAPGSHPSPKRVRGLSLEASELQSALGLAWQKGFGRRTVSTQHWLCSSIFILGPMLIYWMVVG